MLVLLVVACLAYPVFASCTSACEQQRPLHTACLTTKADALLGADGVSCYYACDVSVLWPGSCVAPNDCSSRGVATSSGCLCWGGFGGADCSVPVAGNACHGNGQVSAAGRHCVCQPGFSGSECDAALLVDPMPFGLVAPTGEAPTQQHPLFNLSSIAVLDIVVPLADLITLTDPRNKNIGWLRGIANVTLIQGQHVVSISGGSMKLGGSYSKVLANKGWEIKGGDFGWGVKKLKTKSGVNDMSFMNSLLATDMYRAFGVPVPLVSSVHLFVSSVSHGLAMLYQEPEAAFLKDNFGSSDGNLYKCDTGLAYRGAKKSDYDGHGFEQSSGDGGDWSDLIDFVSAIQSGNLSAVEASFNVDRFLRLQAVESVFADGDGFACSGHNYFLYFFNGKIELFRHDLDDSFGLKSNDSPCRTKAVSYWAQVNLSDWGTSVCGNPLSALLMSSPKWHAQYLNYSKLLLEKVVASPTLQQPQSPLWNRIQLYYSQLAPLLAQDHFFPLDLNDCGGYDAWFALRETQFAAYVDERFKTFLSQN
jgi:hypothetical protein